MNNNVTINGKKVGIEFIIFNDKFLVQRLPKSKCNSCYGRGYVYIISKGSYYPCTCLGMVLPQGKVVEPAKVIEDKPLRGLGNPELIKE
jgi:hypothetical protein